MHEYEGITEDERTVYAYDSGGNVVEMTVDKNMDGSIEERSTYTLDGEGNALSMSLDEDNNGTEDGYWNATCVGPWDDEFINSF